MKKIFKYSLLTISLFLVGLFNVKAEYAAYTKGQSIAFSPDGINTYNWVVVESSPASSSTVRLLLNQDLNTLRSSEFNSAGNSQMGPTILTNVLNNNTTRWSGLTKNSSLTYTAVPTKSEIESIGVSNLASSSVGFWTQTPYPQGTDSVYIVKNNNIISVDLGGLEYAPFIRPIVIVEKKYLPTYPTGILIMYDTANNFIPYQGYYQISASLMGPDNNGAMNTKLTYTSSDTTVATVDANGKVYGVKPGRVTITVRTVNNISQPVLLDVKRTVDLSCNLKVGDIEHVETYSGITLSNSNPDIISFSGNTITALKKGTAYLSYYDDFNSITYTINVASNGAISDKPAATSSEKLTMYIGDEIALPTFNQLSLSNANFDNPNPSIATINNNSRIKALKEGNVTITATDKNNPYVQMIYYVTVLKKSSTSGETGQTAYYGYEEKLMYVGDESELPTFNGFNFTGAIYNNLNPDVVSVNNNGKIKALKDGTATVVATEKNNKNAVMNFYIIVLKKEDKNKEVIIESRNYITKDDEFKIDNPKNYKDIKWESSDPSIAEVDETGKVIGKKNGKVTIKGTSSEGIYIYEIIVANKLESNENESGKKVDILYENNNIPSSSSIKVENIKNGENKYTKIKKKLKNVNRFEVLDITLYQNNKIIQPDGEIVIVLDIPSGYNKNKIVVFRVEEDDSLTRMQSKIVNGKIHVFTNHFSNYVIAEVDEVSDDDEFYFADGKNDNEKVDNPKTGVFDYTILGLMIITSSFIIYKSYNKKTKLMRF